VLAGVAPDHLQLFLLIGQSNMAGRGKVEAQDEVTHPRIFILTKEREWVLAKNPLHFDTPSQRMLGQRYAAAFLKLKTQATIEKLPAKRGE